MREEIKKQFNKLISADQNIQRGALLTIHYLVEKVLTPGSTKVYEACSLGEDSLNIHLSKEEAYEILDQICVELSNNKLCNDSKVSFLGLLFIGNKAKYLKDSLRFLQENYKNLDDQQIYSTLASINPQDFSKEERVLIIELIQKSALMEVLVELRKRNNDKVNDAIFNMWGQLRWINCLDECYFEEYIRSVLWYIRENYLLLDNENINSVLQLLSVEYLSSFDSETLKSLLNEYDFSNILNKIETRKFQDYVNDLKRQTPEELFDLVESFDEGEYKKDQKEIKKTIGDIRKFIRGKE